MRNGTVLRVCAKIPVFLCNSPFVCNSNRSMVLLAILYLFLQNPSYSQTALPTPTGIVKPNPAPQAPGLPFTLPVSGSPLPGTPACAEWTRTAGPNESVVVTGTQFSRYKGVKENKDTRFLVYGDNGISREAAIQRVDSNKAVLSLSKSLPSWSMYYVWPANETGFGSPFALNQTDAWWLGPSTAARGTPAAVFGRNLSHQNDTLASYVYITANGSGQWASVIQVNPYRIEFTVPANLQNGDYEVWVHNGHGGEYGWSGPMKLTVNDSTQWSQRYLNVKDYGAKGDGKTDDTQAILLAISYDVLYPGSTVYFPPGEYLVSGTLYLPSNIRLQGAGKDSSTIRCATNFSTSAFGLLLAQGLSNIEIADLTIDGNSSFRGNFTGPIYMRGDKFLRFHNLRLLFPGNDVFDLHASNGVAIYGCDVIGRYSFLGGCSQLFIDHCNFKLTNDAITALHAWGGSEVSITNSTCSDYNNSDFNNGSGWGEGRFFIGNGLWGSNRLMYLAGNTTTDLTVRPALAEQNTGEQLLWEGNFTIYSGVPVLAGATSLVLKGFILPGPETRYAAIVRGKGLGQSRRITAYSGDTLTLASPWNIVPDSTSVVNIGNYADRIAIYNNYLDGKAYAVDTESHTASAGIEPFGGMFNLVADRNTLHEVRTGISNWRVSAVTDQGMQPNFFSLFANNNMLSCRWAIQNVDGNFNGKATEGSGILGTVYRSNQVNGTVSTAIVNNIFSADYPVIDNIVYEHNVFSNIASGLLAGTQGVQNQIFYSNYFTQRPSSVPDSNCLQIRPKMTLRHNAYQNFLSYYKDTFSNTLIEAPYHVVRMSGIVGGERTMRSLLTLYNSGAVPMHWHAQSSATWLKIVNDSGFIKNESDSSNINLIADVSALSAGSYTADISVQAGDDAKTYSVVLVLAESGPLPLRWVLFDARRNSASDVLVTWKTEGDDDKKGFELERALGNSASFQKIASVAANSTQRYEWHDQNSYEGTTYYRIKQLAPNNTGLYSNIASVIGMASDQSLVVYPNPVNRSINLDVVARSSGERSFCIFDAVGKLVYRQRQRLTEGMNRASIPAGELPKGAYLLKMYHDGREESSVRFVKQ